MAMERWRPFGTKDDLFVTFELPGVRENEVSVAITVTCSP